MRADRAHVAAPRGGGPGVLVLHAWWGLSDGIMRYRDRPAAAGFVAHALDLATRFESVRTVGHWFAEDDRHDASGAAAAALALGGLRPRPVTNRPRRAT